MQLLSEKRRGKIINLSNCKYDILRKVSKLNSFQMIEDADSESDWDIYWTDTGVSLERVLEM